VPKVIFERQTAVWLAGSGGRYVEISHEEPDGSFSADCSVDEAQVLADGIAAGGHGGFRVEGLPESPLASLDTSKAATVKRGSAASTETSKEGE
jgi:hypothetical protein